jgi:hypothetical protein
MFEEEFLGKTLKVYFTLKASICALFIFAHRFCALQNDAYFDGCETSLEENR